MKRNMIAAVLIAFIGTAAGAWLWAMSETTTSQLSLAGNVEVRQVNIGFKVAGRIQQLLVDEGDRVVEGQMLATLDKLCFEDGLAQMRAQRDQMATNVAKLEAGNRQEDIAQAEATVAEREAELLNAQQSFDRAEQHVKRGAGARKTLDDARAAQKKAHARLDAARQSLRLMRTGFRKEDIDAALAQLTAVIGVGLFISSLVSTLQQAMMGIMVYLMPAPMLSGFTSPVQNMPIWLQPVAMINPLTHFLVILRGVFLRDMPFLLVAERIWPMAATAAVTITAASWLFRRRVE